MQMYPRSKRPIFCSSSKKLSLDLFIKSYHFYISIETIL